MDTKSIPVDWQPGTEMSFQKLMALPYVYPDIYYILQPYVMMMSDRIDTAQDTMPSQDVIEHMSDQIYEDVRREYPEITEWAGTEGDLPALSPGNDPAVETQIIPLGLRPFRIRRRRPFRNLIDILLLNELFRRRHRDRRYRPGLVLRFGALRRLSGDHHVLSGQFSHVFVWQGMHKSKAGV